jgi:F0F1-type ATP synthase epsilon subunit
MTEDEENRLMVRKVSGGVLIKNNRARCVCRQSAKSRRDIPLLDRRAEKKRERQARRRNRS